VTIEEHIRRRAKWRSLQFYGFTAAPVDIPQQQFGLALFACAANNP
jgi:hypothetical protein